jgi:GAF domain-containing protein
VTVLAPISSSASAARRIIESAINDTPLARVIDEALLLVTELVTNAIVHAGTDIELHVQTTLDAVHVEVVDQSAGLLALMPPNPSETREGGRGLLLLDALADEWGTRHFGWGKSVWFTLGGAPLPQQATQERPPESPQESSHERAHERAQEPTQRPATPGTPGMRYDAAHPTSRATPHSTRAASRHDISWLVSLPPDLEQRLSCEQAIAELLHRLAAGLSMADCWVFSQSHDDEQRWQLVTSHDPISRAPEPATVRRSAQRPIGRLPDTGLLVVSLHGPGGVFGALVVDSNDALSADDDAALRLVADRIAIILRDDLARTAQLRSRGSLALLAEASEMFAGTLDVQLAMTLATQLVVPRFARWAAAWNTHDRLPNLTAVAHADETRLADMQSALGGNEGHDLAARLARDLVERRPNLLHGSELPTELVEERHGEVLALPLVARRRLVGVLLVGRPSGAIFGPDDVGLLNDLARRTAVAVDSARLYEESTSIARALQASLLPATLPTSDAVEFGARYAAAGEGNEVGGDFYDVFELSGDRIGWGIAIGDVCGKGPEAAAITGMARDILRLLVRDGQSCERALNCLNDAILELGERGRFCTATLGTIEPDGDRLNVCLTLAGHPAPVLVRADGNVAFAGRSGTLLGVFADLTLTEVTLVLGPGDALVFYTDGVTERRDGNLLFGDDNLLHCLRQAAGQSADAVAGLLEESVQRFGAARDDLAVLVVACSHHENTPSSTT